MLLGPPRDLFDIFGNLVVAASSSVWGVLLSAEKMLVLEEGETKEDALSFLFSMNPVFLQWERLCLKMESDRAYFDKQLFMEYALWAHGEESGEIIFNPPTPPSVKGSCLALSLWDEDPNLDPFLDVDLPDPIYRAEAVDDCGCKARVVTIGSAAWITLGHLFRTYLYSCLEGDPEMILGDDAILGAFPEWFARVESSGGIPNWKFLSVDLTSATDTFSSDVCHSLALGVAISLEGFDKVLYRKMCILARNVSVSSLISYPDATDIIQERGMMMGTPESWGILNLYNKFFTSLAEQLYLVAPLQVPLSWRDPFVQEALTKVKFAPKSLAISKRCGDDQVIYGPDRVLDNYTRLISLSGAVPSPGTNAVSERYITFTQSLAQWVGGRVEWIDIVRIISLVDWKGINRLPSVKEVPRIWFRGLSFQLALRWWNATPWESAVRKGLLIFGQYLCSDFIKSVASQGGEPFLPTVLGGLGFPHPTGRELRHVRPRVLRCVIFSLRDDQRPEVSGLGLTLMCGKQPSMTALCLAFLLELRKSYLILSFLSSYS
jgi:hypothetical protein